MPRDDDNYNQCADEIAASILGIARLQHSDWRQFADAAYNLSKKALWKDFIKNYLKAYTLAIKNNTK